MGFKVGDKVRFMAKNSDFGLLNYEGLGFIGDVGIVTEVGELIRVLEKHEPRAFSYDERCLKLMEEMKFKVGDIVEPKKKASKVYKLTTRENNFKGIVTSVYDGGFMVQNYNNPKEIKCPVEEEYFKLLHRPEFKVGDKLKIVDNLSGHCFDEDGIVTICKVCYDDFEDELVNYEVSDDFNNHNYVLEGDAMILEDEVKVEQSFKIGDVVEVISEKFGHGFNIGDKIKLVYSETNDALTGFIEEYYLAVESDEDVDGLEFHEIEVIGWYVAKSEIQKLERANKFKSTTEPIEVQIGNTKVIFNDRYTIAIRGEKKAISKCHPDDEYDARIGLKVAIEKLDVKTKTVRIGDKVRVVSGDTDFHCYLLGQIVEVISIADNGSVDTKGKSAYGNNLIQTLYPRHYEVI